MVTIFSSILLGSVIAIMISSKGEDTKGVGLSVSAEKDLKALQENAELIIQGELDGDYEVKTQVADREHDVYQIDRVYTVTVNKSLKNPNENYYTRGDEVEVVYPVGFLNKRKLELSRNIYILYQMKLSPCSQVNTSFF
ncbi:hypothetical protein H0266_14525 [Halobacillus locisalis]|uniref:Uncharacterized protein n=2 Tax=Halobacillus locisalis TaxID=220753 RepID=A0A838CW95_9BACI|nr:hypothetical protein [Halobacillus locisalis]